MIQIFLESVILTGLIYIIYILYNKLENINTNNNNNTLLLNKIIARLNSESINLDHILATQCNALNILSEHNTVLAKLVKQNKNRSKMRDNVNEIKLAVRSINRRVHNINNRFKYVEIMLDIYKDFISKSYVMALNLDERMKDMMNIFHINFGNLNKNNEYDHDKTGKIHRRLNITYKSVDVIKHKLNLLSKVMIQICTQFVSDKLSKQILNKIELDKITNFKIYSEVELDNSSNKFELIDVPKIIKGKFGEELVNNILTDCFPKYKIVDKSEGHCQPDLELHLTDGRIIMIEVKNYHLDIELHDNSGIFNYMKSDNYQAGIIVCIGKGGIYDMEDQMKITTLYNKPFIYLGKLNLDFTLLYHAINILISKITS